MAAPAGTAPAGTAPDRARARLAACALLGAAALTGACAPSGSAASLTAAAASTAAPTRVVVLEPWNGTAPAAGVTVSGTAAGHCFSSSIATTRPDAYRCLTGNLLYDPCFAPPHSPGAGQVLCLEGAPVSRFLRLRLTGPLPTAGTGTPVSPPFGLALTDGRLCLRNTGTEGQPSGPPLTYTCPRGDLFGFADTGTPRWTIRYAPVGGGALSTVPISTGYR
jgi:hypothetical protein